MPNTSTTKRHTNVSNQNAARRLVAFAGAKSAVVPGIDDELIKVLPELGRVAYARGLGTAFLIWTLLRTVDKRGTRYLDRETAIRYLGRNGITRRKIVHAVAAQKRHGITFWTIHPTRVEYTGQKRLGIALGVTRAVRPMMIRRGSSRSIGAFFGATYAAWIAAIGDKYGGLLMSRAKLSEQWGVSDQQLRRWERAQGIIIQANVGRFDTPAEDDESAESKRLVAALPRDEADEAHSWEHDGQTYFQTINRYITPWAMSCSMGQTRKAAKLAKHVIDDTEAVQTVGTARRIARVFFSLNWLHDKPWQMSATSSSLLETGETVDTRRKRRDPGTGLLMRDRMHYAVYDVSSMRPQRRGAAQ